MPSPKGPSTFEDGVDWDEEDLAEGDLCSGTEAQEREDLKEWKQLRETFKIGLETAKFSKTKAAHPGDLDMECIAAEQAEKEENLCNVGMRIMRNIHKMPKSSTPKSIARQQWSSILNHVVNAATFHFGKAGELNIGWCNDSEDTELSRMSRIAIGYILEILAQGDLCYRDSKDLKDLFEKPSYLKTKPFADPKKHGHVRK